MFSHLLL